METARTMPPRYRFVGLSPQQSYRISLVWPLHLKEYSASVLSQIEGTVVTGEALMQFGLQMPITHPQTSLVFELLAV